MAVIHFTLVGLFEFALFLSLSSAWLVPPPSTADPATVQDCSGWTTIAASTTCASIARDNAVSVSDFILYVS